MCNKTVIIIPSHLKLHYLVKQQYWKTSGNSMRA